MSITIPEIDPIDFLVFRKFPDADKIETAYNRVPAPIPIGSRNDKARIDSDQKQRDLIRQQYKAIESYRLNLISIPSEELEVLFEHEQKNMRKN